MKQKYTILISNETNIVYFCSLLKVFFMKYNFDSSIGRLSQIVSKNIGSKIQSEFKKQSLDYTSDDWTIIAYLYNYKHQTQKELVNATGKNKVSITRNLLSLENKGVIVREIKITDKRANTVSLTKEGEILYKKMLTIVEFVMDSVFIGISNNDIELVAKTLKIILKKA